MKSKRTWLAWAAPDLMVEFDSLLLMEAIIMKRPLQVSFRHMHHSDAIEALVREKSAKLDELSDHIMSCRVVVEPKGKRHLRGKLYEVRIDLTVPGEEIAVTREPDQHTEHEDIYVAVRDAFDAAGRRLEDYIRRKRRDVKTLESMPHAKVSGLFPEESYGFLKTLDGREIYFHRNGVLREGFNRLRIGTEVIFVEEEGTEGPQASTVKIVGVHGHL
jgi:cold shock CspA family protein/ribosome-associated translation inhibitor RaiA